MGKARFIFVLLTATAFLVSEFASAEIDDELMEHVFIGTDKYSLMKFHFTNHYPASLFWVNMESGQRATKLSDDQFIDGKATIYLPFDFQLFDLIVTRVAVTKEGTIQSADPSANWTIAPLKANFGMSHCDISYIFNGYGLYVQWNNFRFNHNNFGEHDFSFQVRLGDKGEIDFVYRRVPYNLTALRQTCHCLGESFGVMFSHQEVYNVLPYDEETFELGFSADFAEFTVKDGTVVRFKCSNKRDIFKHVWNWGICDSKHFDHWDYCSVYLKEGQNHADVWLICAVLFGSIILAGCYDVGFGRASEGPRENMQLTNPPNQAGNESSDADDEEDEEYEEITFEWEDNPTRNFNTYV
ncbi:Hypothetical predicted protein [Cloeon dipterum]|uniref:S-protein homolog n=1 Tax=Cloeon dipterum TaxID=197152 RepID=A0A8S1DF83_9INSE|nr:Hypothetical predicted protein [Cloeon dipterum]